MSTEINNLKKQFNNIPTGGDGNLRPRGSLIGGRGGGSSQVKNWRKHKTLVEKVVKNVNTCWCCNKHIYPGEYEGLYFSHPPEEQHIWQDQKDKFKAKKREKQAAGKFSGTSRVISCRGNTGGVKNRLVLNDKIKSLFLTDHGFTELQLKRIIQNLEN